MDSESVINNRINKWYINGKSILSFEKWDYIAITRIHYDSFRQTFMLQQDKHTNIHLNTANKSVHLWKRQQ